MKKCPKLPRQVLEFFRVTGAEGGKERARRLSPQQRSAIAKKAVQAREAKKAAQARLTKAKQKSSS